jgi:hypothetical protein
MEVVMNYTKAERLAALLDGTCSDEEREELLALLAEDDDELEVFAAAAAALNQYEQAEPATNVPSTRSPGPAPIPLARSRPRWRPPRVLGYALAAGIAALITVGLLRRGDGHAGGGPAHYASQLARPPRLADDWDLNPWGATRGGESGNALTAAERVRLGALLMDLEVLARTDSARAGDVARDIADLLGGTLDPRGVAERYRTMAEGGVNAREWDPELAGRAEKIAGRPETVLGEWAETARIAAWQQDAAFFETDESRDYLAGKGPELLVRAGPQLAEVRAELDRSPRNWPAVQAKLRTLLLRLAG